MEAVPKPLTSSLVTEAGGSGTCWLRAGQVEMPVVPTSWPPSIKSKQLFRVPGVSFLCSLACYPGHTPGDICLSTPGPLLSERIHLTHVPRTWFLLRGTLMTALNTRSSALSTCVRWTRSLWRQVFLWLHESGKLSSTYEQSPGGSPSQDL